MYSSEDLERFYFDYQTEWMPRGMSIQAYCSRNNVPFKVLNKWIRDIYKRVVPVQVTGVPDQIESSDYDCQEQEPVKMSAPSESVSLKITISTSSGMELSKDGLDYQGLRKFIEKLEGVLC